MLLALLLVLAMLRSCRLRQFALMAGYAAYDSLRAVSFSLIRRPMMLGFMPVWI